MSLAVCLTGVRGGVWGSLFSSKGMNGRHFLPSVQLEQQAKQPMLALEGPAVQVLD